MDERIWHRFYDEGVPVEIEPSEEPIYIQLEKTAREFPQVIATDFMGARLTYGQLAAQVNRFASSLSGLGVEPGDACFCATLRYFTHTVHLATICRTSSSIVGHTMPFTRKSHNALLIEPCPAEALCTWLIMSFT